MKALVLLVVACASCFPLTARAVLDRIDIVPASPSSTDTIRVYASGWLPDGCWDWNRNWSCVRQLDDSLFVGIPTVDHYEPGGLCPEVLTRYATVCEFTHLPEGIYTLTIVEWRESLRTPNPDTIRTVIRVVPPVANRLRTWGNLKTLFR